MEGAEKLEGFVAFQYVANVYRRVEVQTLVATTLTELSSKTAQPRALTPFNSDPNRPSIVVESVVADHGAEIDEGLDAVGKD